MSEFVILRDFSVPALPFLLRRFWLRATGRSFPVPESPFWLALVRPHAETCRFAVLDSRFSLRLRRIRAALWPLQM